LTVQRKAVKQSLSWRKEMTDQEIKADLVVDASQFADGDELAAEIASVLSYEWEDCGIGSYEFWGQRGCQVDWQPFIQQDEIWVKITEEKEPIEFLPFRGKATLEAGGCDGEHRGSCGPSCSEVQIPFTIAFQDAKYQNGDWYFNYYIEND
jgi:hypothetical protein